MLTVEGPAEGPAALYREDGRASAPLPAGRVELAAFLVGSGYQHDPGRRDGAGQDDTDDRLPLCSLRGKFNCYAAGGHNRGQLVNC